MMSSIMLEGNWFKRFWICERIPADSIWKCCDAEVNWLINTGGNVEGKWVDSHLHVGSGKVSWLVFAFRIRESELTFVWVVHEGGSGSKITGPIRRLPNRHENWWPRRKTQYDVEVEVFLLIANLLLIQVSEKRHITDFALCDRPSQGRRRLSCEDGTVKPSSKTTEIRPSRLGMRTTIRFPELSEKNPSISVETNDRWFARNVIAQYLNREDPSPLLKAFYKIKGNPVSLSEIRVTRSGSFPDSTWLSFSRAHSWERILDKALKPSCWLFSLIYCYALSPH